VADRLARVKDVPIEEVERVTTENARSLYALPDR
jgi:Tat protein secretion system quality control protein TatD with DNase activity